VNRYHCNYCGPFLEEAPDGDWVKYEDAVKLQERLKLYEMRMGAIEASLAFKDKPNSGVMSQIAWSRVDEAEYVIQNLQDRVRELEKALTFYLGFEHPDDFQNRINKSWAWIECHVSYRGPSKARQALKKSEET
jgi:hypothetical protein